jgi:hypothetical protein
MDSIIKHHHQIYRKLETSKRELKKSEQDKLNSYHFLRGSGIFKNIIDSVTWRYSLSPSDQKILDQYRNQQISSIQIVRQPLAWLSQKSAQILSGNTVDEMIKNLGYDRMWHLFMYIFLQDGSCILTERNETVRLYKINKPIYLDGAETIDIDINKPITLNDFFNNAINSRDPDQFWVYRPDSTNCQDYVMSLLEANNLSTNEIKTFVLQDAKVLLSKSGFGKTIFQTGSNLAARTRFLIGKGLVTIK